MLRALQHASQHRASKHGIRALLVSTSLSLIGGSLGASVAAPLTPSLALAVPPRAGAAQTAWQRHFDEARQSFEAGRFEAAAESFSQAREAGGPPSMLFNQGLALDRLGHRAAAAAAYRRYLAESDAAPNRVEVETRLAALDASAAETSQAAAPTLSMQMMPLEGGRLERVIVGADRPVIRAERQEPERVDYGPTWTVSWFLLVGALGAGGAAIGVWVDGENTFNLLREECFAMNGCSPSRIADSSAHTSALATSVLAVSAGVLGLATVISFLAEGVATSGTNIYVDLSPTGMTLRGTF